MNALLDVFLQNILPIFLVTAMGFALRRRLGLDKQTLSKLTFYAFSPALVFSSLVNSEIPGDEMLQLAAYAVVVTLLIGLVTLLASRLMRLSRIDTVALLLVVMFVNSGNYGLTLNRLRYGEDGLARAAVFFVVSTIMVFTLGVFIASMGQVSWRTSLARLFRMPAFYAVITAVLIYSLDIQVPQPLLRGIELAGAGAIPVMLVVLGMQIADLSDLGRVWLALPASGLRLIVGPIVAVIVAGWFGLQGLNRATSIIEASMPTAVITTILAVEFDVRPGLVTSTVVLTTILSAITLPIVITWLGL
ncbi:MAG: AEC family transporter [Chloroflexota bacterium]|nr:MAG: AEC family transporter [Chloroflexota bacterium]